MDSKGSVYIDEEWQTALVNVNVLTIAQRCGHADVIQFLQPAGVAPSVAAATDALVHKEKRPRSELSMDERAARVGVALKPIPAELDQIIQNGSKEECAAAKKQKQKLQSGNQKIVARAEEARMKQSRLSFGAQ